MVFAATYPERTQALVLWASNADVGLYGAAGIDSTGIFDEFVGSRSQWGNGRTPAAAGRARPRSPRGHWSSSAGGANSATPAAAEAVVVRGAETDVGSTFNTISVPTLVLHREHDPTVPSGWPATSRAGSPARLTVLPGDTHLGMQVGGDDDVVAEIQEFLTGARFGGRTTGC